MMRSASRCATVGGVRLPVLRDLVLAVDESLYSQIGGRADTEILFYLALTFGLEHDPLDAVARTIGFVEATGERHGVRYPFQGTIATTDGERMWAFRYSSEGRSRSLFFTKDVPTLRGLYPNLELLVRLLAYAVSERSHPHLTTAEVAFVEGNRRAPQRADARHGA